jgi:hypothetical protein
MAGGLIVPKRVAEASLYPPVKAFLERHGYTVKGEIRGCDVVAVKEGVPEFVVITELKLGLSMELLLQATDRMAIADEVWIAVPATKRGRDQDRRAHRLCRLLGVGLLTVGAPRGHVEIVVAPEPYRPRGNARKKNLLLREFNRRRGDPAIGGTNRRPVMTAYRQQALDCAAGMLEGPRRPRDLRPACPDAGPILARNVYGYFENVSRGVYALTASGHQAGREWLAQQTVTALPCPPGDTGDSDGLPGADRRVRA